jgi:hypothetical protein
VPICVNLWQKGLDLELLVWYALRGRKLRFLFRGAEAACSAHGSPSGWRNQSVLTDFHELRQDFNPPNPVLQKAQFAPVRSIIITNQQKHLGGFCFWENVV